LYQDDIKLTEYSLLIFQFDI